MWTDPAYETDRFIIKYKEAEVSIATESALRSAGIAKTIDRLNIADSERSRNDRSAISILTTERVISADELKRNISDEALSEIAYIQPDYEMTFYSAGGESASDETSEESELETTLEIVPEVTLEEDDTEKDSLSPEDVIVALLDTGVDTNHPDLAGKLIAGWDFVNDSPNVNSQEWYYDQGHGTSMAGAISSFGAIVMPLKVFEGGKAYTSDILSAISFAEENGARIVNMSFGSRYYNPALEEAIASTDMLFVCASGNMLANIDKYPIYPASFDLPNVLSVSSVDEGDKLARFSNYGLKTVDIAAKGVNISVPWLNGATIETNGTSVSAAIVSGSAARTLVARGVLDATGLKDCVIQSADTITGLKDKIADGKRLNLAYAESNQPLPNATIIDIPDDEPIPDAFLDGEIEEEYEEFGADGLITYRTPMPTHREGLGVVAVGKKIYAIGGQVNATYYNKVEIYDTETDVWTTGTDMPEGVSYFSCVAFGSDIYCIGGFNGDYQNYVQVYNAINGQWSKKTPTGVAFPSMMGTAAVEHGGNIYVSGGYDGSFKNTVYQYNIAGNSWTAKAGIINARALHNAFIYNDAMYIEGGANSINGLYLQSEEIYDLNGFSPIPNGVSRVYGMNASVIIKDKRLIVIGGSSYLNDQYSNVIVQRDMTSANNTFFRRNVMSTAKASHGAVMIDGIVYILGGKNQQYVYNTVEAMEAGYTYLNVMPQNLIDFTAVEFNGGIYIAGGSVVPGGAASRAMYAYNIIDKTWRTKASLPQSATSNIIGVAYGKLYLFDKNASNAPRVFEYDPSGDSWSDIASAPKTFSRVQGLNGMIYAFTSSGSVIDVFDPLTKTWSQAAPRPKASYIYSITALANEIYINVSGDEIQRFDPVANSWSETNVGKTFSFSASIYQDLFYLYKYVTNLDERRAIFHYSPITETLTYYTSYSHDYPYFYQVCAVNNKIYIFAGQDDINGAQAVIEYMPSVSPWLNKRGPGVNGVNPFFLGKHMASATIADKIYLAGGYGEISLGGAREYRDTLFEYDIVSDIWAQKASMSAPRSKVVGVEAGGKFYVIGGVTKPSSAATNTVEVYAPSSNTWAIKASLPYSAHSVAAASFNGKIYAFGGKNEISGATDSVYEYDPGSNTWTQKCNMPTTRYGAGAAELNGKIYVAGGFDDAGIALSTLEVYDPATNKWESKAMMPYELGYCGVVADDGIYVVGGTDGYASVNTVYQYNPVADKWFLWPGMDDSLHGSAVIAANGGIYVINGQSNYSYPSCNYYTPTSSLSDYAELIHLGSDAINPSGNLSRNYSDLSFTAPGFTVNAGRAYNSIDNRDDSPLSKGWSFSFSSKLEEVGNDTVIRMPDGSARTFKTESNGAYTAKDSRAKLGKSGSEHTLTTPDHYQYRYNANGYMDRMTDPNGNQINITMNSSDQVIGVADNVGRSLVIAYTNNRISAITEYASLTPSQQALLTGRAVTYIYDTNGNLSQVTAPDGGNTYYTYNSDGLLWQVKNHNQAVVEEFTYETPVNSEAKRVKTTKRATGNTEEYAYDTQNGKVTAVTGDRVTITFFDKALYPISITDALGGQQYIKYNLVGGINRYGEMESITDRNGNSTFYEYDNQGNVKKIVNPNKSVRQYFHNASNDLIEEIDERGNKTYYEYVNHNLTKKIKPLDGTLAYSSSANQSLFAIESYAYYTTGEAQTMCGRSIGGLLKTSTDATQKVTTYTYDARGNIASIKNPLNKTTYYYFNILGWLVAETSPMGNTTAYFYDNCGRVLKKLQYGMFEFGGSERYIYDMMGNLTQKIEPKQYATLFDSTKYSKEYIIISQSTPLSTAVGYRYTHNLAGQALTETNPLNQATSYQYDVYGNKTKEILPNSAVYTYDYDKLNRLTNKYYTVVGSNALLESHSYPIQTDGTTKEIKRVYYSSSSYAETTYIYDFAGRLLKTLNPDGGAPTNVYLPNGLLDRASDAMGNATYYAYDPLNRMTKRWAPHDGGLYSLTEWGYDNAGRVKLEKSYVTAMAKGTTPSGSAATKSYEYYPDGSVEEIIFNNIGSTYYSYDDDGRVSSEEKLQSNKRAQRTSYEYNYFGKIKKEIFHVDYIDIYGQPFSSILIDIETEYSYDLNGNLTQIKYPNTEIEDYEYDLVDRRTTVSRVMLSPFNKLAKATNVSEYNSLGLIKSYKDEYGNITSYDYDLRGFLTKKTQPNKATTAWEYDLQGRVIKEYSPRALLADELGAVKSPPANDGDWASPASLTSVNYTEYSYDLMGRLYKKIERYRPTFSSAVRSIEVVTNTWDKNGNLESVKDALGNTTVNTYGNAGRLIKTRNALLQDTDFTYDGLGRLTHEKNARNYVTEYSYDLFGNILEKRVDGVKIMGATYDYLGHRLTESDGEGNVTTYTYNLTGHIQSVTNASGYYIGYQYNEMGKIARSLDTLQKEVISTYDSWGRLISITERKGDGSHTIIKSTLYDFLGKPVLVFDARQKLTQYTYDRQGRILVIKNSLGQKTTFAYDANGNKVSETNEFLGNTTTYRYDILNRLINIVGPTNVTMETLAYYDSHLQASSKDALNNETVFAYDALGRLKSVTDAMNNVNSQTYDAAGNINSKTDGNDNTTYYIYDGLNRLKRVDSPNNSSVAYSYDNAGNVLTQTDGRGYVTTYEYNELNLPILRADPGGVEAAGGGVIYDESRIERRAYYIDGRLWTSRDKNGVTTTYGYDIHGRKITEDTGGDVISYEYDDVGNLLKVEDGSGPIVRTYDDLNRVLAKTVPIFGTTTFAYDITGLGVGFVGESATIDGRTTTKVYDRYGRLAQVKNGGDTTNYVYYDNGNLQTQTLPNGVSSNYTYFPNNKLRKLYNNKGVMVLEAYSYYYDNSGNLLVKYDVKGETDYTYTPINQLKTVFIPTSYITEPDPPGKLTEYVYDASGNRVSETITKNAEVILTLYEVDERNRLISSVKTLNAETIIETYFYDDAGNMLSRVPESYADIDPLKQESLWISPLGQTEGNELTPAIYGYNYRNQMIEAVSGESVVNNAYNAEGLRLSKTVDDVATWYCYEYSRVIKEFDSEGGVAYNVYGTNLISREIDNQKIYYLYNGHGDVTALLDSAGIVIASYYYDAFGSILEANGDNFGNPYKYAGYRYDDEVRLYYLNARFYDAKIVRFMQEDTYLGNGGDPLSLNLYVYCRNNPLVYWDPTGHAPSGAYLDTYEQHLIDTGQTTKDSNGITQFSSYSDNDAQSYYYNDYYGGAYGTYSDGYISNSSGSSSGVGSSNGSGGTTGWTTDDYYNYAVNNGMKTEDSPYVDVIDSLLTTDKGFDSFSNVQIYTNSTMNHNQTTGLTNITYNSGGSSYTISTLNNDFYIGNNGTIVFLNQEASLLMNHESKGTFTNVILPFGGGSVLVPSLSKDCASILTPSPIEAATMAQHIYKATANDIGYHIGGGWVLANVITGGDNMRMGVYYKYNPYSNIGGYTLVNKGTTTGIGDLWGETISDWKNNFQQLFGGWSDDMRASIAYAERFVSEYASSNITMIGHSKGGVEAAANAIATDRNAIVFNPAAINPNSYSLSVSSYTGSIDAFIVRGDALHAVEHWVSWPISDPIFLPQQYGSSLYQLERNIPFYGGVAEMALSIFNHQMSAVISAMKEAGYK